MSRVVAITGHRPDSIPGGYQMNSPEWAWIAERLSEELESTDRIISGMALGVDQLAVGVALAKGIPFTAAVPLKGQESKWPINSQKKYFDLLAKAEDVIYVDQVDGYRSATYKEKMFARNRFMVDHASEVLAVFNGSPSGTMYTVNYALSEKIPVVRIDPKTYLVTRA